MKKLFKYVVARPWHDNEPDKLCIYTYMVQVQYGSMQDANEFLEYVKEKEPEHAKNYAIYKVNYTKVE